MNRRESLKLLSSSAIAGLLPGRTSFAQSSRIDFGIDVHCHVFNITDIPWLHFIWQVTFRWFERDQTCPAEEDGGFFGFVSGVAAFLTGIFSKSDPPHAETEMGRAARHLDRGENLADMAAETRDQTETNYHGAIAAVLVELFEHTGDFVAMYFPPFSGDWLSKVRISPEVDLRRTNAQAEGMAAAEALKREIMATDADAARLVERRDYDTLARILAAASGSAIGLWLAFGKAMVSPRAENLQHLIKTYAIDGQPALFTPALVDFSGWLDEDPYSSIPDQIGAMRALQKLSSRPVHMLVPFNPWKQAEFIDKRPNSRSQIEMIGRAVNEMGAIGVKLYPPMGFRPSGNGWDMCWPTRLKNGIKGDLPDLINQALDQLYAYCAEVGVPILAHTHNSNFAGTDYGLRADPDFWQSPLSEWRTLRVCLAHFGAFDALAWEEKTAKLATRYDGLFADLAYQTGALNVNGRYQADFDRFTAGLADLAARQPGILERLVYGSDWHMLAKEPDNQHYPARLASLLEQTLGTQSAAASHDDIFVRNGVKLLGLKPGNANFNRLEQDYAAGNGRPDAWQDIQTLSSV